MKRCGGFQRGYEFETWIALCRAFEVERYVELGWGRGDTAEYAYYRLWKDELSRHGPRIVSVDFVPEPVGGPRLGIEYIHSESWRPEAVMLAIDILGGEPEAVFIDAEHNYNAPRRDFDAWWPVTQKLMGFHDIEAFDSGRLFDQLSKAHRSLRIVSLDAKSQQEYVAMGQQGPGSPYAGIGVLIKE